MQKFDIIELASCDGVIDACGTVTHPLLGEGIAQWGIEVGPERGRPLEGIKYRAFWCPDTRQEVRLPVIY